jgi:hypothetical protein
MPHEFKACVFTEGEDWLTLAKRSASYKKKTVFGTRRNCFRYSYSHELLRCCSSPPLPLSPLLDAGVTDEEAESNLNLHKAVLYVSTFHTLF